MKFKWFVAIASTSLLVSGCSLLNYIFPPIYTAEQCEKVEQNFDRLKVGMTKEEVIPLIGGERRHSATISPGKFVIPRKIPISYDPQQKTTWEVWPLCKNPKISYELLMIVFDTKTNTVVKIFSETPDFYGFD